MEVKQSAISKHLVLAASIAAMFGAAPAFAQEANDIRTYFSNGLKFESADKQHSFNINGRIHYDYRSYSPSDSVADTFDLRRARIGFGGKVFEDISFSVVGDFAASTKLDVAYLNYALTKPAQLRLGQFKMPFGLEVLMSSNNITFQERAFIDNLAPGKERGIMLHGAPAAGFTYAIAASNGAGQNSSDSDPEEDDKDLMGRVTFNIPQMMGNNDVVGHLGLAYTTTTQPAGAVTPGIKTEGRGATFFTGGNPGVAFDRDRLGLEAAFATGPFKLQAEWVNVEYDAAGVSREVDTYYVYGVWAITGESYAKAYRNGVFGGIKPSRPYGKDGGMGAWTVGVRYDKWDASGFPAGTFTGTSEADAITLGVNWHNTAMTRFMLNYVMTDYDTPVTVNGQPREDEKAITLRAQINF
ncbi:MAG: porin [Burkholderiales bacterium]